MTDEGMHVSSSQDETFTRCKRKWWFLYPQSMPSIARGDLDFGTVIHEVCERYLLADDTGRVSALEFESQHVWPKGSVLEGQVVGDPVELYPDGWDTVDDKKGKRSLPPVSSILIKKLVENAIEEGVLERSPGRHIEHDIDRKLIPGVKMIGKIDVKLPGEIQDHKSTKDMKWAKSADKKHWNYLGNSLQMLNYAYESIQEDPSLEEVTLRHNVFCKNPEKPETRKVTVTVTRAQVIKNWNRLKKQAGLIKELTEADVPEEEWRTIEGPSQKDACGDFGGCPFLQICSGLEAPSQYRKRIESRQLHQTNLPTSRTFADVWDTLEKQHPVSQSRKDDMGIFEKREARRSAQSPPSKQSASEVMKIDGSEVAEVAAALDTAPEPEQVIKNVPPPFANPPWAQSDCPACDGKGFNSKGSPCRICDSRSRKDGGPVSSNYSLDTDSKGNVVWVSDDGVSGATPIEGVADEVKSEERLELPEGSAEQLADQQPVAEETPDEAAAKSEAESAAAMDEVMSAIEQAPKKQKRKRRTKKQMEEAKAAPEAAEDELEQPETAASGSGRRKAGYFLYINCMPIGVETVPIEAIFNEFAAELAESQGKESYYDLDVFKRREAFARALTADELAEKFNRLHIVARSPNGAPDLRAFVDAIVAIAPKGRVIQGAS